MPHLMFALALNGYLNVYYASPIPRKKEMVSAGERVRQIGFYTILLGPIVYGIYDTHGRSAGESFTVK